MVSWDSRSPLVFEVPRIDDDQIDDLFYQEDEIGEMRHTAFMIECGLEEDPPDGPDIEPVPWKPDQLRKHAASSSSSSNAPLSKSSPSRAKSPPRLERTASLDAIETPKSPNRRKRLVATKSGSLPKGRTRNSAPTAPAATNAAAPTTKFKNGKKVVGRSNSADDIDFDKSLEATAQGGATPSSSQSAADKIPRRSRLVATKSGTLHGMRAAAKKAKEQDDVTTNQPTKATADSTSDDDAGGTSKLRRGKKSDIVPARSNSGKVSMMTITAEQLKNIDPSAASSSLPLSTPSKPRVRPSSSIRASRTVSCSGINMKAKRKEKGDSSAASEQTVSTTAASANADATESPSRPTPRRGSGLVATRSGTNLKRVRKKEKEATLDDVTTSPSSLPVATDGAAVATMATNSTSLRSVSKEKSGKAVRSSADLKKAKKKEKDAESEATTKITSRSTPTRGSGLITTRSGADLKKVRKKDKDAAPKSTLSSSSSSLQQQIEKSEKRSKRHLNNNNKSSSTLCSSSSNDDVANEVAKKVIIRNGKRVVPADTAGPAKASADEPKRIVFKNGKRVVVKNNESSNDKIHDDSSVESSISQSSGEVSISTSEEENEDRPVSVTLGKWKTSVKKDKRKTPSKATSKPRAHSDSSKVPSINERMKAFQDNGDQTVPTAFRGPAGYAKKVSYRKPKSSKSDILPPAFR
eukprot:CAMPEP_0119552444 /NCGR_PEP_ID=MMETSP1352-20130426/5443_1 /TAXON_ID=265584 /ORGANISM="Stauroneis constricta, Strain CCMP1120" /LENGTH=693 /DNA_ID=CAMNT_0007598685 /DNA_START=584 /DNA_END=2665 /DNA_ORIENTATION=-